MFWYLLPRFFVYVFIGSIFSTALKGWPQNNAEWQGDEGASWTMHCIFWPILLVIHTGKIIGEKLNKKLIQEKTDV